MGQKVSPVGLRVGIIRDWDAAWYANKTDVADLLHEDLGKYLAGAILLLMERMQ